MCPASPFTLFRPNGKLSRVLKEDGEGGGGGDWTVGIGIQGDHGGQRLRFVDFILEVPQSCPMAGER